MTLTDLKEWREKTNWFVKPKGEKTSMCILFILNFPLTRSFIADVWKSWNSIYNLKCSISVSNVY